MVTAEHRERVNLSLPLHEPDRLRFVISACQTALEKEDIPTITRILDDPGFAYYLKQKQLRGLKDELRLAEGAARRKSRRIARRAVEGLIETLTEECRVRVVEDIVVDVYERHGKRTPAGAYPVLAFDTKQSPADRINNRGDVDYVGPNGEIRNTRYDR